MNNYRVIKLVDIEVYRVQKFTSPNFFPSIRRMRWETCEVPSGWDDSAPAEFNTVEAACNHIRHLIAYDTVRDARELNVWHPVDCKR